MLQAAIAKLPEEEAKYHMKRCVDSGLWLPEGGANTDTSADDNDGATPAAAGAVAENDDEEIYHEAFTTPQKTSSIDDLD